MAATSHRFLNDAAGKQPIDGSIPCCIGLTPLIFASCFGLIDTLSLSLSALFVITPSDGRQHVRYRLWSIL